MEIVEATDNAWRILHEKHADRAGNMVVVAISFAELGLVQGALEGLRVLTAPSDMWEGSQSEQLLNEVDDLLKVRWDI